MTTKKKVGLAGIMGMQSRPVEATPITQTSNTKTPNTKTQAPQAKTTQTQAPQAQKKPAKTEKVVKAKDKSLPKSKDKNFKLAGVYLRKTTVGQVKAKLELSDQDMSELVESLLVNWLKKS